VDRIKKLRQEAGAVTEVITQKSSAKQCQRARSL